MKKTMKIASAFALMLIVNSSFAQCTKKTDEMTKTVTVETKTVKIGGTGAKALQTPLYLEASMTYLNGEYLLYLYPQYTDIQTIEKGSVIYVKFDDGNVIQLKNNTTDISHHTTGSAFTQGSNNTIWINTLQLDLADADVTALKTKKVTKIRVQNEDYNVKKPETFGDWISCIEKNK